MISKYIDNINQRYKLGNATEHTFRGDLQQLIETLIPEVRATNEPKRQKCGAPDYILTKKEIPVGFIEAKDIGDTDLEGLKKNGNKEQFDRYKASLNNIIFTDYLQFIFYRDGQQMTKIAIAELTDKGIKPLPDNFASFENLIRNFCSTIGQTIKSSKKLSEMMANKARLLSDIIEKSLISDNTNHEDSTLKDQMNAFKQILIHDITPKGFADVYAQTIAYGMFAARYHDPTLPTFSRQEAYELIPKSNPFLKKLFGYIAGLDVDDRIKWIVDDLVNIFLACDVTELLKDYGKGTKMEDPIIHFYEDFLAEYDPALRKARGVWYTPQPVVNFIVRAVDDILKTEFDLPNGLADTSKTSIKIDMQGKKVEQEVHRVQILDPATGTGTFLAEVVKLIHKKFEGQQGIWSNYVETNLLPRLNGFELLMASYAMAHLKLDLLLTETGYKPTKDQRFKVFLTNSLEEHHPDTGTLFANWLSTEANEANRIKRDTPVMCVIGNPPYSGESFNQGKWIRDLMEDYKREPQSNKSLNEKNSKAISADEYKFIRYGQFFIEKNGTGILAYINPHTFLGNRLFRGMRWSLLKTFDKIFIIDLHGNIIKKETAQDGNIDQNVFDIKQGVSINIFIKTGKKKTNKLGEVFHFDLFGKRDFKYDFLNSQDLRLINWEKIDIKQPDYMFKPNDNILEKVYNLGFSVNEIFNKSSSGVQTEFDEIAIHNSKQKAELVLNDLRIMEVADFAIKYGFQTKTDKLRLAKQDVLNNNVTIQKIDYKLFNTQYCIYTGKTNGLMGRPRFEMMKNIISKNNCSICLLRSLVDSTIFSSIFISNKLVDKNFYGFQTSIFPLYLYPVVPKIKENKSKAKKLETLEITLKQAKLQYNQISDFFHKTVLPFYEKIDNPDEISTALFEENKSTYEEAKTAVENIEYEIKQLQEFKTEANQLLFDDSVVRTPNLNLEIVNQIAERLNLTFTTEKTVPLHSKEGLGVVEKHHINNLLHLKTFRKELRNNLTPAEAALWKLLQGKQLEGRKFRRQHSVGNYILDFYCPSEKLAIELDGEVHYNETAQERDQERTLFLNYYGIKVLRFENKLVFEQTEQILNEIKENFGWHTSTPSETNTTTPTPPLEGGEHLRENTFAPIDILDYIYAVLHSPTYREKYKEFLKIDFPRVPYPKDAVTFWQLVKLGGEIRQIHLLESPIVEKYITQYPIDGSNIVTKPRFDATERSDGMGLVYINDTQYFANVPEIAWNFYIGGYQPAQKWLKDRKGRSLEFEDILHYQKIIVALTETDRIMKEIDKIEIE